MSQLILPTGMSGKLAVPRHVAAAVVRDREQKAIDVEGVRQLLGKFRTKDGRPLPPPRPMSAYEAVHSRVMVRVIRPPELKRRILLPGEAPSMVGGSRVAPPPSGPKRTRGNYPRP